MATESTTAVIAASSVAELVSVVRLSALSPAYLSSSHTSSWDLHGLELELEGVEEEVKTSPYPAILYSYLLFCIPTASTSTSVHLR